jgi:hypothetical protein
MAESDADADADSDVLADSDAEDAGAADEDDVEALSCAQAASMRPAATMGRSRRTRMAGFLST